MPAFPYLIINAAISAVYLKGTFLPQKEYIIKKRIYDKIYIYNDALKRQKRGIMDEKTFWKTNTMLFVKFITFCICITGSYNGSRGLSGCNEQGGYNRK